jgi:hypothetical protein
MTKLTQKKMKIVNVGAGNLINHTLKAVDICQRLGFMVNSDIIVAMKIHV